MFLSNNQLCIKDNILNSFHHQLFQSETDSSWAWCPSPCAMHPCCWQELSALSPDPISCLLPSASPSGAASAVVGRYSFCDPHLSLPCHLTGEVPHKTWALLMSSFWHFILWLIRGKGATKNREERMETKVTCIFPHPSEIYSTLPILRRIGLSHIPSLWLGFWVWLKKNHNLKETKVAIRFFL